METYSYEIHSSWIKIRTFPFRERASSASQFAITDFKQSICSTGIKTKKAKPEIFRDTDKGKASLKNGLQKKKAFSVNKEWGND